jgi:hypothetical protein
MVPIYQTITGELQCVMHEGTLMVREWPEGAPSSEFGKNPRPWVPTSCTLGQLEAQHRASKSKRDMFRLGCMIDCLTGARPSSWYMKPKSEALSEEIEALMAKREAALAAEIADRPAANPSLFEGAAACVSGGKA